MDTIRSGPPSGALETLFQTKEKNIQSLQKEVQPKISFCLSTVLRLVSYKETLSLENLQKIYDIATASHPRIRRKCNVIIYNNLEYFTEDEIWQMMDAKDRKAFNFINDEEDFLEISIIGQRVFSSIKSHKTEWFTGFILKNLEKLSSAQKCCNNVGNERRFLMQLISIMFEFLSSEEAKITILSATFMHMCTSIASSGTVKNDSWKDFYLP